MQTEKGFRLGILFCYIAVSDFSLRNLPLFPLFSFIILAIASPKDDAGSSDGEQLAISDDTAFARWNLHIIDKSAGIAVGVTKHIFQQSLLIA